MFEGTLIWSVGRLENSGHQVGHLGIEQVNLLAGSLVTAFAVYQRESLVQGLPDWRGFHLW